MHKIIFYASGRGDSPVRDFLLGLDRKTATKVYIWIGCLAEKGPNLRRPYADHVRGPLRELRVQFGHKAVRILYFFRSGDNIVLLHGFLKKDRALPESDIRLAEERMKEWIGRSGGK